MGSEGYPETVHMPDTMAEFEWIIQENWQVTNEVVAEVNASHDLTHSIIHNMLQYQKPSARCIQISSLPSWKNIV